MHETTTSLSRPEPLAPGAASYLHDLTGGTAAALCEGMHTLLRTLALALLFASCTGGDGPGDSSRCVEGEQISDACASASGNVCESATCTNGSFQCPEGLFETPGCPSPVPPPQPSRDCSDLGGGQAVVGERCLGEVVEYCIWSDTTQTATWSEIQTCSAPESCRELNEDACCQSADAGDACLD
jgi:hypothetical protein